MQVSFIQTKGLEMPFLRFIQVVTSCNMSTFESDAHLIDVQILTTDVVALEYITQMFEERVNTPEGIIFLHGFHLFKTVTSKAFLDKSVGVSGVITPI